MGEAYQLGSRGKTTLAVATSLLRRLTTCPDRPIGRLRSVIPGRGRQPASPLQVALADLDIKVPISGKPEIGARPGMT